VILLVRPIIRLLRQLKVESITNEPGNEMIRIGIGRNNYRPFARVDAINKGYRVTKR
jgi:hypothetical protein